MSAFSKIFLTPHLLPALVNRFLIWSNNVYPRPFEVHIACHHCLFFFFFFLFYEVLSLVGCFLQRNNIFRIFPSTKSCFLACSFVWQKPNIQRGGRIRLWSSSYCCQVSIANCCSGSVGRSSSLFASDIKVTTQYLQTTFFSCKEHAVFKYTKPSKQSEIKNKAKKLLNLPPVKYPQNKPKYPLPCLWYYSVPLGSLLTFAVLLFKLTSKVVVRLE